MTDVSWREQAACIGRTEMFFPAAEKTYGSWSWSNNEAKQVCMTCPVLAECECWEEAHPQRHGIWAGRTPSERDIRRRQRRRARLVTV